MRTISWFVVLLLAACTSTRPTPEEIERADVGPPPSEERVRFWIEEYFDDLNVTGAYELERKEPRKAYYVDSRPPHDAHYGWRITCHVSPIEGGSNDANIKKYDFYFQGDQYDAIGFKDRTTDGRDFYAVLRLSTGGAPHWAPDQLMADPGDERFELPFH